jgi:L-ribulokinase
MEKAAVNHLPNMAFTLGIDYGSNSVRALFLDVSDGRELATCVVDYPSGKQGILLDSRDANLAGQHPGDYLFGLEKAVLGALEQASKESAFSAGEIIGIGVDPTGSSQACALSSISRKRRHISCPWTET